MMMYVYDNRVEKGQLSRHDNLDRLSRLVSCFNQADAIAHGLSSLSVSQLSRDITDVLTKIMWRLLPGQEGEKAKLGELETPK